MKVNLFIVGAPKAGTTSLYNYLSQHVDVLMSSEKEPDFFSRAELHNQDIYYIKSRISTEKKYHDLFNHYKNEKILGEASVSYLYYSEVPKKIIKYNPNSKIIIMLRNPSERAYSHYLMDFRLGLNNKSFLEVFDEKNSLFFQQYFKLGRYYDQVKRYIKIFGRNNIHVIWHHEFTKNTQEEVFKVFDFLNIKRLKIDSKTKHNKYFLPRNIYIKKFYSLYFFRKLLKLFIHKQLIKIIKNFLFLDGKKPQLDDITKKKIDKYFSNDIEKLEDLLLKKLDRWK